jgi:hypothetical protein
MKHRGAWPTGPPKTQDERKVCYGRQASTSTRRAKARDHPPGLLGRVLGISPGKSTVVLSSLLMGDLVGHVISERKRGAAMSRPLSFDDYCC